MPVIDQAVETADHQPPAVSLTGARLAFGDRVLWDHLDLSVSPGEFIAVLGPNGTGKTSLLKVLLGQLPLSAGAALVDGKEVTSGSGHIGYVPQHRPIDREVMLRGRDLVRLGIDGRRWGCMPLRSADRARRRAAVRQALRRSTANSWPMSGSGVMSGGELQRVRIAQALASDPMLLLCDEPLLTLDPANAKLVAALIDRRRREADTTVIVVTHEINPILPYVDRVLYLVDGRFRIGTVEQVMTTETLSTLYRADIQVVKVNDRYVVVGEDRRARADEQPARRRCWTICSPSTSPRDLLRPRLRPAGAAGGRAAGTGGRADRAVHRDAPDVVRRARLQRTVADRRRVRVAGRIRGRLGALIGSALAAALFGVLGQRARERDSVIGVVLAFGLGLAVLFIHLYPGRTATSFALLTGQIVGVGYSGLAMLALVCLLVIAVLATCYRPLLFATVDPDVAAGRGVPVRALGIVFAALVGVVAAQAVQIVGALLVMSLLITPAAAAARVVASPAAAIVASVVFAEVAAVGGIVLSLAPGVPVSVFVATISFLIYLFCWLLGRRREVST